MIKTLAIVALASAALAAYCPMPSNFRCPAEAVACQNDTLTGKPYDGCCVGSDGLLVLSMNWTAGHIQNPAHANWWGDLTHVYEQPKDQWVGFGGVPPYHCDGTYSNDDKGCDQANRVYYDVEQRLTKVAPESLISEMRKYWLALNGDYEWFWSHEFTKHGTCFSVIDPACYGPGYKKDQDVLDYFKVTMALREKYPLYKIFADASIVPSDSTPYKLDQFHAALKAATGHTSAMQCQKVAANGVTKYYVAEIYIYMISRPGLTFDFIDYPVGSYQSCPANTDLWYLPLPSKP
ncbi:ribonuclease T2-like [Phlyctochytrium planicorne]|nr:ribonuclease T2-like [Phlyctochytrium planicorne]